MPCGCLLLYMGVFWIFAGPFFMSDTQGRIFVVGLGVTCVLFGRHLWTTEEKSQPYVTDPDLDVVAESGYVYIIRDISNTGYYKIGFTNDTGRRFKEFTKFPFDWETIHIIPTSNPPELERVLHNQFAQKRRRGEWFDLSGSDLLWIETKFLSARTDNNNQA